MSQTVNKMGPTPVGWRFKLGVALFAAALLVWLLVPLAAALGVPAAAIAGMTGAIFVGNKLLFLAVIAVMGKQGFLDLKRMLSGYVAGFAPKATVGPTRYRIGLVMFCLPLVLTWFKPWVDALWPEARVPTWQAEMISDLVFVASFFVLGGNFWAKIRALFVRTAVVAEPGGTAIGGGARL